MGPVKVVFLYLLNCLWDFVRGLRYNYNSPLEDKQKRLYYKIIITAHTVEKGLSLHQPRPLFGQSKIRQLLRQMEQYDGALGMFPLAMGRGAIADYLAHHERLGAEDPFLEGLRRWLDHSRAGLTCDETGGMKWVEASFTHDPQAGQRGLSLDRRFSCRHYAPRQISLDLIRQIIQRAQRAPSQCNRQSARVHCYQDRDQIERLLALQGGSTGFSQTVHNLFVVTSELTAWGGAGQRNQSYVDGGLFAMCLMLACVEEGLQCCPLNLAVTNHREGQISRVGDIPSDQRLIVMIAFGECDLSPMKAAASPRLAVDDVLTLHSLASPNPPSAASP